MDNEVDQQRNTAVFPMLCDVVVQIKKTVKEGSRDFGESCTVRELREMDSGLAELGKQCYPV